MKSRRRIVSLLNLGSLPCFVRPKSALCASLFRKRTLRQVSRLWDAITGVSIGDPLRHQGAVLAVAFHPDGSRILTGTMDNTARIWDANTGDPIGEPLRHDDAVTAVAFSPDGSRFLVGGAEATRLWNADTLKPMGEPCRHRSAVTVVAFSPDGSRFVTGPSRHPSGHASRRGPRATHGTPTGRA